MCFVLILLSYILFTYVTWGIVELGYVNFRSAVYGVDPDFSGFFIDKDVIICHIFYRCIVIRSFVW